MSVTNVTSTFFSPTRSIWSVISKPLFCSISSHGFSFTGVWFLPWQQLLIVEGSYPSSPFVFQRMSVFFALLQPRGSWDFLVKSGKFLGHVALACCKKNNFVVDIVNTVCKTTVWVFHCVSSKLQSTYMSFIMLDFRRALYNAFFFQGKLQF